MDMIKDHFVSILNELRHHEGDELVNEFQRIFVERIPKDVKDLIDARKHRDFDSMKRKAHFLSTTLVTLKFHQGLIVSSELEKAIELDQKASALLLTDQLIEYLNSALIEIE